MVCPTSLSENYNDSLSDLTRVAEGSGYGYNNWWFGCYQSSSAGPYPCKMTSFRNVSGTIIFGDTARTNRTTGEYQPQTPMMYCKRQPSGSVYANTQGTNHFRHNFKCNVAWADGHATAEPFGTLNGDTTANIRRIGFVGDANIDLYNPMRTSDQL